MPILIISHGAIYLFNLSPLACRILELSQEEISFDVLIERLRKETDDTQALAYELDFLVMHRFLIFHKNR